MKTEEDCFKSALAVANQSIFAATYLMTDM